MLFDISGMDQETIEDFLTSIYESLELMEHDLTVLERDCKSEKSIHSLVIGINQLKSQCRICYLEPFIQFLDALDALFIALRTGHVVCTNYVREICLLALDTFRYTVETLIQVNELDLEPLLNLGANILILSNQTVEAADKFAIDLLENMGKYGEISNVNAIHISALVVNESDIENNEIHLKKNKPDPDLNHHSPDDSQLNDLNYFREMAESLEERYLFWKARSKRTLALALSVNYFLEKSVDENQLKAAVYMHDVGMVFLPDEVVNKNDRLNSMEERILRRHPKIGYDLLIRIPGWREAAEMVYCHHERPDGSGYPRGLKADEIPIGAQILAVVDTYFSITRQRADRLHKKSLLRAVKEIHNNLHTQFVPEVANSLINVVAQLVEKKE